MEPDRHDAKVARVVAERAWLHRLAGRIDYARAEDLAQETLLAALVAPAPCGRVRAWLAAILRNLARETRRREGRRTRREERAARAEAYPAEDPARMEAHARVAAALGDLAEPYRATVRLHFLEGFSLAEIARQGGLKDSTVRNRLRRGLARLRARLEEEFGGTPLALAPLALPRRRPRLSIVRIAAAAALLAGAVYARAPEEDAPRPPPPPVVIKPAPPPAP